MNPDLLARLASATARVVLRALRALSPDVAPRALALIVGRANVRGHDLGTVSAARELKRPPPLLPGRPTTEVATLETSFREVLTDPSLAAMRAARIAKSEPVDSARDAFLEAAKELGATRWRRVLSTSPCPLCVSWAGEFDISTGFRRHPHCTCRPELILEGG